MATAHGCDRSLLAELRRQRLVRLASELSPSTARRAASGLAELDRLGGGGLWRGCLHEIRTGREAGAGVLHALLGAACDRGELGALLDVEDGFDPRSASMAGVALGRVLWVRPPGARAALQAAELLLQTGVFDFLALDWGALTVPVPTAAWSRLTRLARDADAVLVSLGSALSAGASAALAVEVRVCRPRWAGAGGPGFIEGFTLGFRLCRRRGPYG